MLYKTKGLSQDQLLTDLLAIRKSLEANWLKGGFVAGGNMCLVATVNKVTSASPSLGHFLRVEQGTQDQKLQRFGRAIVAIYQALRPNDSLDLSLSQAQHKIASFNDTVATQDAVLLLLDKAINLALTPALVE